MKALASFTSPLASYFPSSPCSHQACARPATKEIKELQHKHKDETFKGKRDEMPRRHTAPPKGPDALWKQICFQTLPVLSLFTPR